MQEEKLMMKNSKSSLGAFYKETGIIDAICFATNYNNTQLIQEQKYVFKSIANLFGKDVGENIFIIAMHCDEVYDYAL